MPDNRPTTEAAPKVIAITGHRPETFAKGVEIAAVQNQLWMWLAHVHATYITGGARGVDQWAAQYARHHGREYRVYLPFPLEVTAARWQAQDRKNLERLLRGASKVTVAMERYSVAGYHARDRAMVDDADEVLAVWDGRETGGTAATVAYAKKQQKPVHVIDPRWYAK